MTKVYDLISEWPYGFIVFEILQSLLQIMTVDTSVDLVCVFNDFWNLIDALLVNFIITVMENSIAKKFKLLKKHIEFASEKWHWVLTLLSTDNKLSLNLLNFSESRWLMIKKILSLPVVISIVDKKNLDKEWIEF